MRKNKGFVLVELLAVVSILIAMLGITGVNSIDLKANLNQIKANSIAQQIYVSAQNKITELYTSGQNSKLEGNTPFSYVPDNYYPASDDPADNKLQYIVSDHPDIEDFCNYEDEGKWIIEYDSALGRVFGVFWTSGDDYDFYSRDKADDELRHYTEDQYKQFAKDNGYNIAYYGGNILDTKLPEKPVDPIPDPEPDPDPEPEDPKPDTHLEDDGFCYWEKYSDGTFGVFYVYNFTDEASNNYDGLSYGKTVVADGYGIAVGKDTGTYLYMDREADINTIKCYTYDELSSDYVSKTGCLYMFDKSIVDETYDYFYNRLGFWIEDEPVGNMYSLVNPIPIYVNMHFARNGINVGKGHTNPTYDNGGQIQSTLYVRSARQLYDLSLYYEIFDTSSEGTLIIQDTNIDMKAYDWANYCTTFTTNNAAPTMKPIGAGAYSDSGSSMKNSFMCIYDAGVYSDDTVTGTYSIKNLNIVATNGYSGLFAKLKKYPYTNYDTGASVVSGIVRNLTIDTTTYKASGTASNTGIICGLKDSTGKIENCNPAY